MGHVLALRLSSSNLALLSNMAQQGGTYRSGAAAALPALSTSSSQPRHKNGDTKDKNIPGIEEGGDDTRTCDGLSPSDHALELANAPPKALNQAHGKNEDQDWEMVQQLEAGTGENPLDQEFASHFDLTLGWGRYKLTIFSCDMSFRRPGPARV
ncbi:hypothetical protein F4782DRAFT_475549 [Xylaria castorea]|nr:hypothetical protein F4782DRAFT_475549 [Xylaria castorea]